MGDVRITKPSSFDDDTVGSTTVKNAVKDGGRAGWKVDDRKSFAYNSRTSLAKPDSEGDKTTDSGLSRSDENLSEDADEANGDRHSIFRSEL